jgi:hypothetical protein
MRIYGALMHRSSISFTTPQAEYLRKEADRLEISVGDFLRRLVDEHRASGRFTRPIDRSEVGWEEMERLYGKRVADFVRDHWEEIEERRVALRPTPEQRARIDHNAGTGRWAVTLQTETGEIVVDGLGALDDALAAVETILKRSSDKG